jgi:hypothetical protein
LGTQVICVILKALCPGKAIRRQAPGTLFCLGCSVCAGLLGLCVLLFHFLRLSKGRVLNTFPFQQLLLLPTRLLKELAERVIFIHPAMHAQKKEIHSSSCSEQIIFNRPGPWQF